jgi:hypothetical protein
MALEPPPTAGNQHVGHRPSTASICSRVSWPITDWKVAHQHRIGMRAGSRADQVIGVIDIRDPVAQRLVHRVLQRAVAGGHRVTFGAEKLHAEHVRRLPLHIGGTHIDFAFSRSGRNRGRGHAMLAGAGFGDDARLAHAFGKQDLPEAIVDLVAAGVIELVALEVDLCPAQMLGQALGEIQRRGTTGIGAR